MPRAPRLCLDSACREHAEGGPYCPIHKPQPFAGAKERWAAGRPKNYNSLRRLILRRDKTCTHDGCDQPSTEVDHVVPVAEGGDWSPRNLAGLCSPHHLEKTVQDAQRGRQRRSSKGSRRH